MEHATDQVMDNSTVNLVKEWTFEVIYRNMGKGLEKYTFLKESCIIKVNPSRGDISEKLETWSTLSRL